jgi:hypothetical protein
MTASEAIRRIKEHTKIHLNKEPQAVHITEALLMACDALELIDRIRTENEALTKRLRHLLKSDTIRKYDEYDPKTHTYKRDISKFDAEIEKLINAQLSVSLVTERDGCNG